MKFIIFYSWQSDLDNSTNRGFIEDCLKKASKKVTSPHTAELEICIDRDTAGLSGAPDIKSAIFEKIDACDLFVADVSIVTGLASENERPAPNPNVLIELGYAIQSKGWDRIVLVSNEANSDSDKDFPFDISQHRRERYSLNAGDLKAKVRKQLVKQLERQIQSVVDEPIKRKISPGPELHATWLSTKDSSDEEFIAETPFRLYRCKSADFIRRKLQHDIEEIKSTTAGYDADWEDKKSEYLVNAEETKEKLNDPSEQRKMEILYSASHFRKVALRLENKGSHAATEVLIEIKAPDWLFVKDAVPDLIGINPLPVPPRPKKPDYSQIGTSKAMEAMFRKAGLLGTATEEKLSSMCTLTQAITPKHDLSKLKIDPLWTVTVYSKRVSFSCKKISHKRNSSPEDQHFWALAEANAPPGEHVIDARVICEEMHDWQPIKLTIVVEEMNLNAIAKRQAS